MSKDGRTLETSGTKLSKGEKTQAYAVCAVYPEAHAYVTQVACVQEKKQVFDLTICCQTFFYL